LIAASPGPDSSLEDLTVIPGELEGEDTAAQQNTQSVRPAATDDRVLMEVIDLVKEFPKRSRNKSSWPWAKSDADMFRAVDHVSFSLQAGESLGLVGESGCGKSTTSAIINRLLDPNSGEVIFDGENITTYPASKFALMPQRMKIQMVFQDPTDSLNPRYTAMDSIAEPLKRLMKISEKSKLRARVEELADKVGLPRELLSRFPHQLSGGQKARVGIARAISVDPRLLVLDEPTSALDVSVQAVVLQLLDRLKRELGMSYIFVSHDLNVVRLLCDRIIVMSRGAIVETGSANDVLRSPQQEYTRSLISAIPHFEPGKLQ
jgi:peptide/nickel transport system ATP-binding protein